MNKIIPLLTVLVLTSSANAVEYNTDSFEKYGYGSAASVIPDTNLKSGLRGLHVACNHPTTNAYYPGYLAVPEAGKQTH
jgi:hypothetical protein